MKALRATATAIIVTIALVCIVGSLLPRFDYARQDREHVGEAASRQHWLGTDDLGRDRFSRLLHGTRLSLLLAPAAALLSLLLALAIGATTGFTGGLAARGAKTVIDLFLSVPWLFLLLMVRALLPLNTSPGESAAITFLVLGLLGWAAPARILQARASRLCEEQFILLARATGVSRRRLLWQHLLPNLKPVLLAQFWIAVPIFILSEANLSLLGLGVSEPLPSLGSLLREMETVLTLNADASRFAALILLIVIMSSLQIAVAQREVY